MLKIRQSTTHKLGFQSELRFQIGQHSRDKELLKYLVDYLGCGKYTDRQIKSAGDFVVAKSLDIIEKVIPFFDKYPLHGPKALDLADFKKAAEIMKVKGYLTPEGLDQIRLIKSGMNIGRK